MRTCFVACLALLGCGGGSSDPGTSDEPNGMVKIDGAGSVTVKDQNNTALPDSPFTCEGGNCGGTDVLSTTRSITFTAMPVAGFKLTSATIENGSGDPSPVTAGIVISVDSAAGWTLSVVFDPG